MSSADGRRMPSRLDGISLVTDSPDEPLIDHNIYDTGSATTLLGEDEAENWLRRYPTCVKKVRALKTSIQRIRGIGALNYVQYWLQFRVRVGGAVVLFTDVPVLRGHRGFLLGNDFIGKGRVVHDASPNGIHDGNIVLRDVRGRPISRPVPFRHTGDSVASFAVCAEAVADELPPPTRSAYVRLNLSVSGDGTVTSSTSTTTVSVSDEETIRDVAPVAFTPKRTRIDAWSQADIRLRVPFAAKGTGPVALMPLEDLRLKDLGVMMAPGLSEPDEEGYVVCRVINLKQHPVELPKLVPIARFIVNPKVTNADIQFTIDEILEKIHLRDDISPSELEKIRVMLTSRRRLFRSTLGYVHGAKMTIPMPKVVSGEEEPPNDRNRVRSPPEDRALRKELDKQLKQGLIEPTSSPFNAIPMLIRKPGLDANGDPVYRVVIDYRKVNLLTEKNTYPLPNVEQNLASLGRANWFTCLDLLQGFHQVELDPDSRPATAFGTKWGQYRYTRAPMGLTSSPGTFVQLVDAALRGLPPGVAIAYVDDIIIPTCGTFDDHLCDVGMVLDRLIESGFAVRMDKMWLGMREAPYLGFLVGAYGTRPLASKTSALTDLSFADVSADAGSAARFAGMASFYSRFIPGLHNLLKDFHKLKSKSAVVPDVLKSLKLQCSFEVIKHLLANATALQRPDFSKPFYIDVDAAASGGIGACLGQYDDNGALCPLAFWSRRFTTEERRYGVRDQECLGLSDALTQWRQFILGGQVIARSDHKSLRWLLSSSHPDGSRVSGWALKAQNFDLEIQWVPGRDHVAPDFFSRTAKGGESEGFCENSDNNVDSTDEKDIFSTRLPIEERLDEMLNATDGPDPLSAVVSISCNSTAGLSSCLKRAVASAFSPIVQSLALVHLRVTAFASESAIVATADVDSNTPAVPYRIRCVLWRFFHKLQHRAVARIRRRDHRSSRISVAFVRETPGGFEVLSEPHDGELVLPCVATIGHNTTYRRRISQWLYASYDETSLEQLLPSLRNASSHRRRSSAVQTHYFVAALASDFHPSSPYFSPRFIPIHSAYTQLSNDNDRTFVETIRRELVGAPAPLWLGSFKRLRSVFLHRCAPLSYSTRNADALPEVLDRIPCIAEAPDGPAFCVSTEDCAAASKRLRTRLDAHPHLPLAIDLEGRLGGPYGHVSLLQAAVDSGPLGGAPSDGSDGSSVECPLVFVFDVHCNGPGALGASGPHSLRCLLEDPSIVKVLHCCYGDASALYYEYKITLRNVFDTGLADRMVRSPSHKGLALKSYRHLSTSVNSARGLAPVLYTHLGDSVTLTHKGHFEHEEGMWNKRPLHPYLFVYSYEDVVYMGRLYAQLAAALRRDGTYELAVSLSHQRCPPLHLPQSHPLSVGPNRAIVVVTDLVNVICVRDSATNTVCLPFGAIPSNCGDGRKAKDAAVSAWVYSMGDLPKILRAPLRARLQRPFRIGCALVFVAKIDDCHQLIGPLNSAPGSHRNCLVSSASVDPPILVVPCHRCTRDWQVRPDQLEVFQLLHMHSLFSDVPTVETNVALGRVVDGNKRGAAILHDASSVFVIIDKDGQLSFPSAPIEIGSDAATAAGKGFDNFAGVALRKSSGTSPYSMPLCSLTSSIVRAAFDSMLPISLLADKGNTQFYSCYFSTSQFALPSPQFNSLSDFRGSFHAARCDDGFELTEKVSRRFPGFDIVPIELARERLAPYDLEALQMALTLRLSPPGPSQHSDVSAQHSDVSFAFGAFSMDECHESEQDDEAATLVAAAAVVYYSRLISCMSHEVATSAATFDNAGVTPESPFPSLEEFASEQQSHPALAPYFDYFRLREIAPDRAEFQSKSFLDEVASLFLSTDGCLMRTGSKVGDPPCILVPPSLQTRVLREYHDRSGHFGVLKVLPQILRGFYWGSHTEMRKTISEYIRTCPVCQRVKIPHHKAGEFQIDSVGSHPNDILEGDVFEVGVESDGYDRTLDFADTFTRGVTSTALQGAPNSEEIARVLLNDIIRHRGVPRELRTDNASVFVSAAIGELAERLGIHLKVGTAYRHKIVALVERWHSTLKQMLHIDRLGVGPDGWYKRLPLLELAFNTAINQTTGYSPFFLTYLRHVNLPLDSLTRDHHNRSSTEGGQLDDIPQWVKDHLDTLNVAYDAVTRTLRLNSLSRKRVYDLRHDVSLHFQPGNPVLVVVGTAYDTGAVHRKAAETTDGPFVILSVLPFDEYILQDRHTHQLKGKFHVSRLLPYHQRCSPEEWQHYYSDNGGRWPVRRIVDRRRAETFDSKLGFVPEWEYCIRWLGWPSNYDSWRSRPYLDSISELVNAYNSIDPLPDQPSLDVVPRATDVPPLPASEAALRRPHFRASAPSAPAPEPAAPSVALDISDRFPAGSRVRIQLDENQSQTGTVIRTFVSRARPPETPRQRRIIVQYDDPKFQHKVFEHTLDNSSDIVLLDDTALPFRPPSSSTDAREARRAERENRRNIRLAQL